MSEVITMDMVQSSIPPWVPLGYSIDRGGEAYGRHLLCTSSDFVCSLLVVLGGAVGWLWGL